MRRIQIVKAAFFSLFIFAFMSYDIPEGWYVAGSHPKDYDMGTDKGAGMKGNNAATIKSNKKSIDGFGTLMQSFEPNLYKGKHLRLTGYMKTVNVKNWAGFWVRVDGNDRERSLSFDNMYERAIKGNTDWTKCEIVVAVPEEAVNISFGALLNGTGQIWFDEINMEAVDKSIPLTGIHKDRDKPKNLNFDK